MEVAIERFLLPMSLVLFLQILSRALSLSLELEILGQDSPAPPGQLAQLEQLVQARPGPLGPQEQQALLALLALPEIRVRLGQLEPLGQLVLLV